MSLGRERILWINDLRSVKEYQNLEYEKSRIGQISKIIILKDLLKYKLDLVGVQEVRWGKGGTEPSDEYTFFYGKGNQAQIIAYKGIISAVKKVHATFMPQEKIKLVT
jgi:hypothetical protein